MGKRARSFSRLGRLLRFPDCVLVIPAGAASDIGDSRRHEIHGPHGRCATHSEGGTPSRGELKNLR